MSEPFIGEIRMVGFNFAPKGWALCDGQTLSIAQNSALFALLGTTYGGNGTTTFCLPDLRGRVPVHQGQAPGLSLYALGEVGGSESVTLLPAEMPAHSHALVAAAVVGNSSTPQNTFIAETSDPNTGGSANSFNSTSNGGIMNPGAIGPSGGSQPHANIQPYLCVNFVIALVGIFPSRN